MSSIWNNCLSKLENEISSSEFNTWIRPLQAIENERQLKLLAPNRFVMDWVKERFFAKMEELINEFSNGSLDLVLEIGSKVSSLPTATKTVKRTETKKVGLTISTKCLLSITLLKVNPIN